MIYYRVKMEYDNLYDSKSGEMLIGDELYTEDEFERHPFLKAEMADKIDISEYDTCCAFGARF